MRIDNPSSIGTSTINGNLTVTGTTNIRPLTATTLNLTAISGGTSVTNLSIDSSGNIVSGNTPQNWVLSNPYTSGATVLNNGIIYQSNGVIPASTAFTLGTTGSTWRQIAADANATYSSGKTYSSGALVINNKGVLYQANAIIPSGTTFTAGTSGATWNIVSRTGKYAYWAPYVVAETSTPVDTGAVVYQGSNLNNLGGDGIQITNTSSDGQNGNIAWNITDVDFNQDFRMMVTVYLSVYVDSNSTGDGFSFYAGGSSVTSSVYGDANANGALKFNLFTYPNATNQTLFPAGASIWTNTTKILQGKTGQSNFVNQWITYVVEVSRDKVTNKRFAQAYMTRTDNVLGGRWPIGGGDVTNWVPGGGYCGIFFSTGAARSAQQILGITFESM